MELAVTARGSGAGRFHRIFHAFAGQPCLNEKYPCPLSVRCTDFALRCKSKKSYLLFEVTNLPAQGRLRDMELQRRA